MEDQEMVSQDKTADMVQGASDSTTVEMAINIALALDKEVMPYAPRHLHDKTLARLMSRAEMIDEAVQRCLETVDFCAPCIDSGVLCSFCKEDFTVIRAEFRRIEAE